MTDEITPLDIDRAYRLARLREIGIGLVRALETPHFYRALCNTARAMKLKQQQSEKTTHDRANP